MSANYEARFAAALAQLTGGPVHNAALPRLGLAVSGGPDSLALLLLAHAVRPGAICVATVDHELRDASAAEAAYVARICAEHDIEHRILRPEQPIVGNLQSAARATRYRLLEKWADDQKVGWLATAHHADDQLETLLMRIARGSGIAGLSAIRAINGRIIRPLLGFTKAELVAYCAARNVAVCNDPSNFNADFERVQFREWLKTAPRLLDARRVARTVSALAEAHSALEWAAARAEADHIKRLAPGKIHLDPHGLPAEIVRRLLIRALKTVDPAVDPRGATIDRALTALDAGRRITVGNIVCQGGPFWELETAPKRRQNH